MCPPRIDASNENRLERHIVLNTEFAPFTTHTRVLDSPKSVTGQCVCASDQIESATHGAGASDMAPVLIATMPVSNLSDTRCDRARLVVMT